MRPPSSVRPALRLSCAAVLLPVMGLVAGVDPAAAQIHPPAPGVEMPAAYYERIAADRTAFQFRRAWFGATERAAEARRLLEIGLLSAAEAQGNTAVTGTRYVPVLAGKFANTPSDPYSPAQLQDQLFDGPNPTGTVTDYYNEISYGMIVLTGTVHPAAGLYQVSQNDTYYEGTSNGLGGDAKTGQYLKELLDAQDPLINFGMFDNDGPDGLPNSGDDDGYVDFVAFVQPENGGECGGSNIWSHRWVYEGWWGAPYTTGDPAAGGGFIRVSDYTIQPLLSCNGVSIIEIGVYAHEFGHAFGLPDLYDTNSSNGSSAGVGTFCLMGSGSYGGDNQHPARPAHMCAWSKSRLGWVVPEVLCGNQLDRSLADVETAGEVVKIYPHGIVDTEYFLIENRVRIGFDQYLYNDGLLIWHVDESRSGNGDENQKLVDLEEADGLAHMDANANRGDAGDFFPGSTNKLFFTDGSNPSALDNQGQPTGLAVTGIDATANPRGFDIALTACQLRIGDVTVDDYPHGNNNARIDGFERFGLEVCLGNDFAVDRTGITGTLTALTAGVNVLSGAVAYGTVSSASPNCGSGAFEVEATTALAAGSLVSFRLDLSGDAGFASSISFSLGAGNFVLLVEDDGAAEYDAYFQNAIANSGFAWVHHDAGASGLPALGQLRGALAVVWYVGSEYDNTFTPAEQALIADYLDGGGALFVTGQDVGYDLIAQGSAADQAFYRNYFRADFVTDSSNDATLAGVAGDPIGDGLNITLSGTLGQDLWPSVITARPGASEVLHYSPSRLGALRWETAYKLVYFAFDFERIATPATRATVMSRVLSWLVPADYTPPSATLLSPTGGELFSACAQVPIQWTATDDVGVTGVDLEYSGDGGATWNPIAVGLANTGSHLWSPVPVTGSSLKVKVRARDAMSLQGVDWSDGVFTVDDAVAPTATVRVPNGGETFAPGAPVAIAWSSADDCSGVDSTRVWLSVDGGAEWTLLGTAAAPDTTFAWVAPGAPVDSCLVRVEVFDGSGNAGNDESDAFFAVVPPTTGFDDRWAGVTVPILLQNSPNPFGAATRFTFYLPVEAAAALRVYDLSGRLVRTVLEGTLPAGPHDVLWDGRGADGRSAAGGIYFYVLENAGSRLVRKLVLTR